MHPVTGGQKQVVAEAYRNARGPIAFLDESYQVANVDITVANTFYILTAVIVEFDQMDELRDGLRQIAQSDWWHTTEALQQEEGRAKVTDMLEFLAEGLEPCLIALQVPIGGGDPDGEAARRVCYRSLATQLAAGREGVWAPVDLLVLEERNQRALRGKDQRNHREVLADKLAPRGTRLLQTSPAAERLLWLPDLVAAACRRSITHHDQTRSLFDIIKERVHFMELLN